jgi:hypothetical protein
MRPRLAVLTAALLLLPTACHRPAATRTDHHETRSFTAGPGKIVRLDLRSLDAEVRVGDGAAIEVEVTMRARSSSTSAARRWVERNMPTFDDSPSRLEVAVPSRSSVSLFGFLSTEGTVRVTLPAECALEIHTGSGDVALSGDAQTSTPVRVETSSGDVTVSGGAREMIVETSSGDIRIGGTALAVLDARTTSGDIRLDSGAAKVVADTSSGDVILRNLTGPLSASTSSGDVQARWRHLPAAADIRVETSSGDATLRMPAGAVLEGEVRTSSGDIRSDFGGEKDRHGRRLTLAGAKSGGVGRSEAPAAVMLSVRTTAGDVALLEVRAEI